MEKYNVFKLYVVKIIDNYFICENVYNNIYKEIFTNEKFQVLNSKNVESLTNYYSILGTMNYSTGEPLLLSKIELLLKYAEINAFSIAKKKQMTSCMDFIEYQNEYLKALKECRENNPEMAKQIAIESLRKSGILDENGEIAFPFDTGISKTLKKNN